MHPRVFFEDGYRWDPVFCVGIKHIFQQAFEIRTEAPFKVELRVFFPEAFVILRNKVSVERVSSIGKCEWSSTCTEHEKDYSEREYVNSLTMVWLIVDEFRCHKATVPHVSVCPTAFLAICICFGQAEVYNFYVKVLGDHDVFWLDVSV